MPGVAALAARLVGSAASGRRVVVAIAGPPGSGKSTCAEQLRREIDGLAEDTSSVIMPMDGFHFDDAVLNARGERDRKGAPHTFDVEGYAAALQRIVRDDGPVAVPVFDRSLELSRAGALIVEARHRIVVTEGNYLLVDDPPWRALYSMFNFSVFLDVPEPVLKERLVARWLGYGFDADEAERKAQMNDLVNARFVETRSRPADMVIRQR